MLDSPTNDVEVDIDLDRLIKPELDEAEKHLRAGYPALAEAALNSAAETFRILKVPNTSPRYRQLSSGAAHLRYGEEWRPVPE
jgi:hypothetical protein